MKDEIVNKHESYAVVRVSDQRGGNPVFFGSPVKGHPSYICLSIHEAEEIRSNGISRFHGKSRPIVELKMTNNQFVEMIRCINQGAGVPVTLVARTDVDGKVHRIDPPPDNMLEPEKVRVDFKDTCQKLEDNFSESCKEIHSILEKKNLTIADKDKIKASLHKLRTEVGSNLPFILELFQESTEKIINHAKIEVESFTSTVLKQAGLSAIKDGFFNLLGTKKED